MIILGSLSFCSNSATLFHTDTEREINAEKNHCHILFRARIRLFTTGFLSFHRKDLSLWTLLLLFSLSLSAFVAFVGLAENRLCCWKNEKKFVLGCRSFLRFFQLCLCLSHRKKEEETRTTRVGRGLVCALVLWYAKESKSSMGKEGRHELRWVLKKKTKAKAENVFEMLHTI